MRVATHSRASNSTFVGTNEKKGSDFHGKEESNKEEGRSEEKEEGYQEEEGLSLFSLPFFSYKEETRRGNSTGFRYMKDPSS